jgi:hypothetical protein
MMRYRRSRIPGTGPPTPAEVILCAAPGEGFEVGADGRVRAGQDVAALNRDLRDANVLLRPIFGGRERLRQRAGTSVGGAPPAPDLSVYYRVLPAAGGSLPDDPVGLNAQLRSYGAVAAAYIRPPAVLPVLPSTVVGPGPLPVDEPLGPTEDYSDRQGYLDPAAAGGIDARYAWTVPGGRGEGVRVADLERGWWTGHEDLDFAADDLIGGIPSSDIEARNHGTSVAGILAAAHNLSGVMGICPAADVKATAITGQTDWDSAAAIRTAADHLSPGDIILIEEMVEGPNAPADGPDPQAGYIPGEWWPLEFAAVQYAVSRGIIVVQPAGNGSENLDSVVYQRAPKSFGDGWRNPLRRGGRDSGSIFVGAGAPPPGTHGRGQAADRSRLAWSNWGSRVDVQGWGLEVTTTGGNGGGPDALRGGQDPNGWYTDQFCGTSSAAPIVAGALACVQGMLRAAGRPPLTSIEARELLREADGHDQQAEPNLPASQRIGPRPDLRELVERLFDTAPSTGGAKSRVKRRDMASITITIQGENVQIDQGSNGQSAGDDRPATAPQRKGPSLVVPTGGNDHVVSWDDLGRYLEGLLTKL